MREKVRASRPGRKREVARTLRPFRFSLAPRVHLQLKMGMRTTPLHRLLVSAWLALATATALAGQTPAAIVSPEVHFANAGPQPSPSDPGSPASHFDRTVTFRIAAPKATEVSFFADWLVDGQGQNVPQKMEKSADGVWSLTLGPLAPTTYIYWFSVDGVVMADPVNPRIKLRARGSASLVDVPVEPPTRAAQQRRADPVPWEIHDVPHGTVTINWQQSTVLNGETRQVWVYTPPGYEQEPGRHFPVLYLLHGNNDTAAGWTIAGNENFIFDNLLAAHQAVPMVVVMPFGHALPYGTRQDANGRNNTAVFEDYLFKDVMPLVEARFRLAPGREERAIAGLSMGAEQSLYLFFHHLDVFSAAAAFCPSGFPAIATDFPSLLADPKATNARIAVLWLGCGRQDPTHFPGTEKLANFLTDHQINHLWRPTEGYHNFALWREYLVEFAPLLFHAPAGTAPAP
jgi:enterochelin esterase-like enzyme